MYKYIYFLYSIYGIGWKIAMPLKIPIFTDTNPYFYLEAARIITYYITQKILGGLRKIFEKKNIFWQKKNSIKNTVFCITVDILWVLISFRKLGLKFLKYFQYCYRVFFSQAKKLLMRKKWFSQLKNQKMDEIWK